MFAPLGKDVLSIILTSKCTRVGLVFGITELVFIFVCKQDAQCNWAGKATKKGTEVLLYAMAGIRWILAYFVSIRTPI